MPLEGVVHALRAIHAALVPGGLVVDTQPVSPQPIVEANGAHLGTLDLREWLETIRAVDRLTQQVVDDGLFTVEAERRFEVADEFDSGPELCESLKDWRGTRVPRAVGRRIAAVEGRVAVSQEIRLRLLRTRAS